VPILKQKALLKDVVTLLDQSFATLKRNTSETKISVEVCLDGTGSYKVKSGIGFFDHMLSLLSKHSGIDMKIKVQGDLQVDKHHSVEDTGLALAMQSGKRSVISAVLSGTDFLLPMDESLAQVALDLGGRPFVPLMRHSSVKKWANFQRN